MVEFLDAQTYTGLNPVFPGKFGRDRNASVRRGLGEHPFPRGNGPVAGSVLTCHGPHCSRDA